MIKIGDRIVELEIIDGKPKEVEYEIVDIVEQIDAPKVIVKRKVSQ